MKFCENCGTQLADDATFCEECGAKQENPSVSIEQPNVEVTSQSEDTISPLSKTCSPAKREIRGWLMALLLVICSPLVLANLILIMPDFLFWIFYIGAQIGVLVLMWKRCNWKLWIKICIVAIYVLMYVI